MLMEDIPRALDVVNAGKNADTAGKRRKRENFMITESSDMTKNHEVDLCPNRVYPSFVNRQHRPWRSVAIRMLIANCE